MCEFISDLEGALSSLIGTTIISFNKCSRNHTVGDYIIHCDETSVNNVLLVGPLLLLFSMYLSNSS